MQVGSSDPASPPPRSSGLWKLASEVVPSEYVATSFAPFVPLGATDSATAEGLRCTLCRHCVDLRVGSVCDGRGEPYCSHCAACVGLLGPPVSARWRAAVPDAMALRDLSASANHLHRMLRRADDRAARLQETMEASQLRVDDCARPLTAHHRTPHRDLRPVLSPQERACALADAARGVLAAFDEALAFTEPEEGREPPGGADELMERLHAHYEPQIPTGLAIALRDAELGQQQGMQATGCMQPPPVPARPDSEPTGGAASRLRARLRKARLQYQRAYAQAGLSLGS